MNIKYKINLLTNTIKAVGICSECGSSIKVSTFVDLLGQLAYCPKCYRGLYLDYYKLEDFSKHFEMLCNELKCAEKLVIAGVLMQAMNILRYDHFGLDFKKIIGFLDLKKRKSYHPLFAYLPRIKIEDLLRILPDTILVADDPAGNAELKLRLFYFKNGVTVPKILHLIPENKRLSLQIASHLKRVITKKGIIGIAGRLICNAVIRLLRLWELFLILKRMFCLSLAFKLRNLKTWKAPTNGLR